MSINITDSLTLETVKTHLHVDLTFTDDDSLIQSYIDNSLAYTTNYCVKTFETYENVEDFPIWENDLIVLEWATEVRTAIITYTDDLAAEQNINVTVYADNVIREIIPDDYNGGAISVAYTPYIDSMNVPTSHQARLLMIGDFFSFRENSVAGTQIAELGTTGSNNLLNTIKLGIM